MSALTISEQSKEDPADFPVERVLETPVKLLRGLWAWSDETRNPKLAFAVRYGITCSVSLIVLTSFVYVVYGEYDSSVSALSGVVDIVAGCVIISKVYCVFHYGNELRDVRSSLQHSFQSIEDKLAPHEARAADMACVDRARSFCRRMLILYVAPCIGGVGTNFVNMFLSREERQLIVKAPAFVTQSAAYWVIYFCTSVLFGSFIFISGGFDTLFLTLCMHLRTKCDILRKLFRHVCQRHAGLSENQKYAYWRDDGSDFGPAPTVLTVRTDPEVEEALKACVQYHQLIIGLRDTMERVFSGVTIVLMSYLLLGLGIPALRVLFDKDMDFSGAMFLILYTTWNFFQLYFYCSFPDSLARSSQEVAVAAYSSLRPDLPKDTLSGLPSRSAATLILITQRAQKPLHLTAGNFVNLTLELYLEILRRSQSIYSYLLRLR